MAEDKVGIGIEAVKVGALAWLLFFTFDDADLPGALLQPAAALLKAGIVVLAYMAGRHFAETYEEGWKNYLLVLYGVGILTLVSWAGLGTHVEDADPLFGGGETVVDFVPRASQRDNHALTIFFTLLLPAMLGVRHGPTKRAVRIQKLIAPKLRAVRSALEADTSRSLEEGDRQDVLHRRARQALVGRDLTAFRTAIAGISDVDRRRDAVDDGFRSLLIEAAEAGATDFVDALLCRGAAINQADAYRGSYTPLHLAAQGGHLSTARILIERGAEVNIRDQWGHTALWYAATCHGGHPQVIDFLLRSGADPSIPDSGGAPHSTGQQ